jgi:hypothetical protein
VKAIRVVTKSRTCAVALDDVATLAGELRRLSSDIYPDAADAAGILEASAVAELAADVTFTPGEEDAVLRALQGLETSLVVLPDGLQCMYYGMRLS